MIGVVLAGKPECLEEAGGRSLAAWAAAALCGTPDVGRVAVVGPGSWSDVPADVVAVSPGESLVENLNRGLEALGDTTSEVLIAAGDAPFVTPAAIGRFAAACRRREAGLGYPIVPRTVCEERFPGVRRTYVRMREGSFTGGNCIYLAPAAVRPALARVEAVYQARKQPVRLARLLGFGLLLRLLVGAATVGDAERAASRILGVRACGIVCDQDPELGIDIDRPADLEWASRLLADRLGR